MKSCIRGNKPLTPLRCAKRPSPTRGEGSDPPIVGITPLWWRVDGGRNDRFASAPINRDGNSVSQNNNRGEITPMDAHAAKSSGSAGKWSPPQNASEIVKSVHAMLHPRNIVLVGATDKPGNYAERIWNNLVKYKYQGGLYPLNARRETIWGVTCYKDFASLPEPPDHVLV